MKKEITDEGAEILKLHSLVREMEKEFRRYINLSSTFAKDVGLFDKAIAIINRPWVKDIIKR